MERLQKVLAQAGVASRRSCEELIVSGRVQVNGVTIRELGTKVDPASDVITVDQQPIAREKLVYLLLYKPIGVITSLADPEGRKVVTDLLPGIEQRVYPVGRLDYDTSGLLLLTNDGDLANRLAHPSYELDKVYRARVKGKAEPEEVKMLAKGIMLDDGMTAPGEARIVHYDPQKDQTLLEIVIHEGRNRQVRRMCAAIGHPVVTLERIRIAFLTIGKLRRGEYRHLTPEEVQQLKNSLQTRKPRQVKS
ncbi:pseudouridine synthase [Brevibacillus fluminis]|uniref:pseudouridine synthase n=1 Tax=Brevibacillus fluminis TaxID=511487 RepID=UPI003F891A7C